MNRYLRMGTRRSGAPRPKPLDDGDKALAREGSPAIDSIYKEIERELDAVGSPLDEEEDSAPNLLGPAAASRAWSGERGDYVAVCSPGALPGRLQRG